MAPSKTTMILTPAQKAGKRRFPRQKARDQKIMGLPQWKNVAKLL
jgi:hypothetical protein